MESNVAKLRRLFKYVLLSQNSRSFHLNTPPSLCRKYKLDKSKIPVLNDEDLHEQFVHGSGPGGQCVNKTLNCVVLRHIPTGIVVKNHETRSLQQNRERARAILITKLDNLINGEDSIENQKKKIDFSRWKSAASRQAKKNKLKEEWKQRELLYEQKKRESLEVDSKPDIDLQ